MTALLVEDLPALIHEVISRACAVRDALGAGFPAALYLEALRSEAGPDLGARRVDKLFTAHEGRVLPFRAGPTLVVGRVALVHAVVVDRILPRHRAALARRLEALELRAGVLLNFADDEVEAHRCLIDEADA